MIDPMTRSQLLALGIPDEVLDIIAENIDGDGEALAALNAHEQRVGERCELDMPIFKTFSGQFGMGVGMLLRAGVTREEMHEFVDLLVPVLRSLNEAFEAYDKGQRS